VFNIALTCLVSLSSYSLYRRSHLSSIASMVSEFTRTDYGCVVGSVGSVLGVFGVAMLSSCALISTNTTSCLVIASSTVLKYSWVVVNEVVLWSVYVYRFYSVLLRLSYLCWVSYSYLSIYLFYAVISLCTSVV
jgi:hypothetical protein